MTRPASPTLIFLQYMTITLVAMLLASKVVAQSLVAVAPVKQGNLPYTLILNGNIVSAEQVEIGNEIAGKVYKVQMEAGDSVQQGQPLLQLRDTEIRWQLQEAQAELSRDQAEVTLAKLAKQRVEKLIATNAATTEHHDQALARLEQAQAAVIAQQAQIGRIQDRLERHLVRAPFDGMITQRNVEKGSWMAIGDTIATLVSQDNLRLELSIPQHLYSAINQNRESITVSLQVAGLDTTASFERIIPIANKNRNFTMWATINNLDGAFIPGMAAEATVRWPASAKGLYVPEDALVRRANGTIIVWKVVNHDNNEHTAVAVPVITQHSYLGDTLVDAPELAEGDNVVIQGNETLRPEQKLSIQSVE